MKTILFFSAILIALFTVNISNAQCVAPASDFGNNSNTSYNITGEVTVTLNTGGQTITLSLGADFRTATGPDVMAYLIKSNGSSNAQLVANGLPSENIFLGQVSDGTLVTLPKTFEPADIPSGTNIEEFDTVFFYCLEFSAFWDLGKFEAFSATNCSVLGIEDSNLSEQITTYPNPVTDKLYINNNTTNAVGIKFYSILGELLFEEKMSNKKTVDTSRLNSGIYFVELSSDNKKLIKRIIKR